MIRNWAAILKGHLQTKREFNPGYLNRGYPVAKKKMQIASLFDRFFAIGFFERSGHWSPWRRKLRPCSFMFTLVKINHIKPAIRNLWFGMIDVCPSLKRGSPVGTLRRKGFKLPLKTQKIHANTSFFMGTWGYPMPTPPLLPGYWPSLSP